MYFWFSIAMLVYQRVTYSKCWEKTHAKWYFMNPLVWIVRDEKYQDHPIWSNNIQNWTCSTWFRLSTGIPSILMMGVDIWHIHVFMTCHVSQLFFSFKQMLSINNKLKSISRWLIFNMFLIFLPNAKSWSHLFDWMVQAPSSDIQLFKGPRFWELFVEVH